jgi:hypothetical protein
MTLKTDFIDGDYLYAGTTSDTDKLNGITNAINAGSGILGEVRMFALSISGAVTKSTLQGYGWAICDGTTPTAQGISGATITTTPDLREKFLRHSEDETTGGTGGSTSHNHQWYTYPAYPYDSQKSWQSDGSTYQDLEVYEVEQNISSSKFALILDSSPSAIYTKNTTTSPPYYDICFFIKVK